MILQGQLIRSSKSRYVALLICLVFFVLTVSAQTGVVNNGAKIIVNTGAYLKIKGSGANYTNTTSNGKNGRIDLDGKIQLEGDWVNNSLSDSVLINPNTDGIVLFNGILEQNITGTGATLFENLSIDNSAGFSLATNIGVKNVLTLTNGLVLLNSNNLTIGNGGSLSGSFSSTRMFVTNGAGEFRKSVNSSGSFTFPIGEILGTAEYSPVVLDLTSGAFASAWIGVHVTDADHPENTSLSEYLTRYWSLSSSGITSPVYNATFNYMQADVVGSELGVYSAQFQGATRNVYSTVNTSSNLLLVSGLSTFADYTGVDGTSPATVISTTELNPTNSSPTIPFKVTFTEEVTGFDLADIVLTNGSASNFNAVTNPEFSFDVTPLGQGEITLDVAANVAMDVAGNNNSAADQFRIEYDSISPSVNLSSTATDPTDLSPFPVKIQFTEKVSGFILSDISVTNGSANNLVVVHTDSVWTVDITPLGDGTVFVDVNAGVAADAAGNGNLVASQFSIDYDGSIPTVAISTIASDPTNAKPFEIIITFSELVTGFALSDILVSNGTKGNLNTSDNITYTADINPIDNGLVTVNIPAMVAQDVANNDNSAADPFSINYDGTKPGVTISSGETSPTNLSPFQITISFTEVVNDFLVGDITVGNGSAGNLQMTTANQVWTADITPSGPGNVTVDMAADLATDLAGNGNTSATPFSILFDNVNPTMASLNPSAGELSVAVNSNLEINFNETVHAVLDSITLFKMVGDVVVEVYDVTTDVIGDGTSSISVNPSNDLSSFTEYYIQISANAFDDDAGNSFAGIADNTSWSFTTVDISKPYISSTIPLDNDVDIAITSNLEITFSEAIFKGTGNITVFNATDVISHETIDVNSGQVTISNNVVTISPGISLVGEKNYYILIDATAFKDLDNNTFLGISNPAKWNFTTEDLSSPIISSTVPEDESKNVTVNSDLEITFSENVAKGTGNIIITNSTTVLEHESIDVNSAQVTISSNKVTINPILDFNGGSDYYVQMASGVFTDASSNANSFTGISDQITWNFSTEDNIDPAVVLSTSEISPTNNASFDVNIVFNEKVKNLLLGDISVTNGTASNLSTSDSVNYAVTIAPVDEDTVRVLIPAGVAQDSSGNSNSESNEIKLFYDITSPTVVLSGPSGIVGSEFDVTITFNEGITDLVIGNITVQNGSVSNLSSVKPDTTWLATITPLIDGTISVDILLNQLTDIAGNGNEASNQFSIEYDGSGPEISSVSPANGATVVAINQNLEITFNENAYPNSGYFINIYESGVGLFQQIDVTTVSGSGTSVISIDPADFSSETSYYVLIDAQAFIDDLGNGFAGISLSSDWVFTTADVEAPTFTDLSPVDNISGVAINSDLVITFNENVNKNIGSITVMDADANLEHEVIDVTSGQVTVLSNVATINLLKDLESEVNYYVLVGQSTFQDLSGNKFQGITTSSDWNFVTEDLNPPVIASVLPEDNAINITLTESLELSFDEIVVAKSGNITIRIASSNAVHEVIDINSDSVSFTTSDININPTINFTDNTEYYVLIDSAAISDIGGNDFGGILDVEAWSFTTGDFTSPSISSLSPANNTPGVAVSSKLFVTFNEPVYKNAGNITIYNVTNSSNEIISVSSAQVSVTSNVITITPSATLESESEYYVLIDYGSFTDVATNSFAGISSASDWTFITEDAIPPEVTALSPQNNDIGVSNNTNLAISFNEDIFKGTGNISIVNGTTNTDHEVFDIGSTSITIVTNTLAINPAVDFDGLSDYYVLIEPTAIVDANGNNFAGIASATDWKFTTGDQSAPVVILYLPADDAVEVPVNSSFELTFNEAVLPNTGNITIMDALSSTSYEVIDVLSTQITIDSNIVSFDPVKNFESEKDYYIIIDNGAFKDADANLYGGISSSVSWNFTSEDIVAPDVSSVTPSDNSVNVSVTSDLGIVFSETISKGVSGSITIWNADASVIHETIDITNAIVSITANIVSVNPSIDFAENTNYYVLVENTCFVDEAGNAFAGILDGETWSFKTIDTEAPSVSTLTPPDNSADVLLTADLQIVFTEEILVNAGNITIMNADADSIYEIVDISSVNLAVTNDTVLINPTLDFLENTNYYVFVDNDAFRDVSGNSFSGILGTSTWNFKTTDLTAPVILSVLPVNEAINVGLDSDLEITFSEIVVANSGLINIMNGTTVHESIDVFSNQVTIVSNMVTINPAITFTEETDYHVLIDNGAFHDESGRSFIGITDQTEWKFTTLDVTTPVITALSPSDEASAVGLSADLQITFSEAVLSNTGYINIMNGATVYENIDAVSDQVVIDSNLVTINPSIDLVDETNYYVLISNTAFQDLSGNSFEGIADETLWNFETEDTTRPGVVITSVESGTVSDVFELTVTFSEWVTGFAGEDIFVVNGSVTSFLENTPGEVWTASIAPIANGDVSVDIPEGVAQDGDGNLNTAATSFNIVYNSGVGFEEIIPYSISMYSIENKVIVEFTNHDNYQFETGRIEIYNLLGQKLVDTNIDDFIKFETELKSPSQIYVVKLIIDNDEFTKRLYIE